MVVVSEGRFAPNIAFSSGVDTGSGQENVQENVQENL